jgi:hypothetical protein
MFGFNPVTKESQLHNKRIKPTQKQMGDISPKVRKEVKERSSGLCEVRKKCLGSQGVQLAHLIGRKQLKHKTTAKDLLDSCIPCHKWLDETPEGIKYKKQLTKGE